MNGQTFLALEALKNADIEQLILLQALTDVDPPDGKNKIAGPSTVITIGDARPTYAKEVLIYFGPSVIPIQEIAIKHTTRNLFDISKIKPYNSSVEFEVTDGKRFTITNLNRTFSVNAFNGYSVDLDPGTYYVNLGGPVSKSITASGINSGNLGTIIRAFSSSGTFTLEEADTISFSLTVEYKESYSINEMQICKSTQPILYEPYAEQNYIVDFSNNIGDLFGGTLDLINGVLSVTHDLYNGELRELSEPLVFDNMPKYEIRLFENGNVFSTKDGQIKINYIGKD